MLRLLEAALCSTQKNSARYARENFFGMGGYPPHDFGFYDPPHRPKVYDPPLEKIPVSTYGPKRSEKCPNAA